MFHYHLQQTGTLFKNVFVSCALLCAFFIFTATTYAEEVCLLVEDYYGDIYESDQSCDYVHEGQNPNPDIAVTFSGVSLSSVEANPVFGQSGEIVVMGITAPRVHIELYRQEGNTFYNKYPMVMCTHIWRI